MKTTILVDTKTLVIKVIHLTTQKAYDGHIGMQVYRRYAEDLQVFLGDKGYLWSELREGYRENGNGQ